MKSHWKNQAPEELVISYSNNKAYDLDNRWLFLHQGNPLKHLCICKESCHSHNTPGNLVSLSCSTLTRIVQ